MINKLTAKIQKTKAPIVVGLDPMLNYIPKHIQEKAFKEYLLSIGDSLVVVADDEIVKVHVHTNAPGDAIQRALTYGQLSNMKPNSCNSHKNRQYIDKNQYQNTAS